MGKWLLSVLVLAGASVGYAETRPQADHAWIQSKQLGPREHNEAFQDYRNQGYRPYWMHVQVENGRTVISTAYTRDGSPGWMALYGLSPCDLRTRMKEQIKQGRKVIHLQKYEDNGATRYAAIWNEAK